MDHELLSAIRGMLQEELEPFKQDVAKRFDGVDERFTEMDQRFDGVDERFTGLDQRFDGVDERFTGIDNKLDGLDQKITSLQEQSITTFHAVNRLGEAQVKFSDNLFQLQSDGEELQKGQMRIEDRLDHLDAMAEATQAAHRNHEKRIRALEDKITA